MRVVTGWRFRFHFRLKWTASNKEDTPNWIVHGCVCKHGHGRTMCTFTALHRCESAHLYDCKWLTEHSSSPQTQYDHYCMQIYISHIKLSTHAIHAVCCASKARVNTQSEQRMPVKEKKRHSCLAYMIKCGHTMCVLRRMWCIMHTHAKRIVARVWRVKLNF